MTISGNIIHDSSVAEEIAGHEDLVTEILLRLPVKSLLRFELVSKKWLSLISHPRFAQNYARLHNPSYEPSGVLMTFNIAGFQFVPFNGDGDHARVMLSYQDDTAMVILQSCNGLLICSSCTTCSYPKLPISQSCDGSLECSTIIFPVRKFENYICNPTTKQFTTIPFPSPESRNDVYTVNLAFDPLKSPHYKLLSIRIVDIETSAYQIDIYSSETGSWRPPISGNPLIFTAPESIVFKAPVYWRGAIHWYTYEETDLTSLYFNTDTECLKTMPMPPFQEYHHVLYFGESKGHLHLIGTKNRSVIEFDIWELETDYSRWFVRYHVNLDAVLIAFPQDLTRIESTRAFSILYFARAEKEEESTLVLFVSGKAVSFNFHKNTSKKLCDLVPIDDGLPLDDYDWYDAYQYIETLFHV